MRNLNWVIASDEMFLFIRVWRALYISNWSHYKIQNILHMIMIIRMFFMLQRLLFFSSPGFCC